MGSSRRVALATSVALGAILVAGLGGTAVAGRLTPVAGASGRSSTAVDHRPRFALTDIAAGPESSGPRGLDASHGLLFFGAHTQSAGFEPWVSDGTAAGTRMLADTMPGPSSSVWRGATPLAAGTLLSLSNPNVQYWTGSLWLSTARPSSPGTTTPVTGWGPESSTAAARVGRDALVHLSDFQSSAELWRTDGTPAGTRMLKDGMVLGTKLRTTGDRAFFRAPQSSLWVSDGTTAGTVRLHHWADGPDGTVVIYLLQTAGRLAFLSVADPALTGEEMWVSDGTRKGTHLLKDIRPGPAGSHISWLTPWRQTMYFVAGDGRHGPEVWRSDGTEGGTVRLTNLRDRNVRDLTVCRGRLFFTTADARTATLWAGNPTTGESTELAALPGSLGYHRRPHALTCMAGGLVLTADDGEHGREPWTWTDGADHVALHDLRPGPASSKAGEFTRIGSLVFFHADDGVHGDELWTIGS